MKKLLLNTTAIALLSFISFQIILYIESYISSEVGATDFGQYKFVIRLIHFLSHVLLVGQDYALFYFVSRYLKSEQHDALTGYVSWVFRSLAVRSVILVAVFFILHKQHLVDFDLMIGSIIVPIICVDTILNKYLLFNKAYLSSFIPRAIVQSSSFTLFIFLLVMQGYAITTVTITMCYGVSFITCCSAYLILTKKFPLPSGTANYQDKRTWITNGVHFTISTFVITLSRSVIYFFVQYFMIWSPGESQLPDETLGYLGAITTITFAYHLYTKAIETYLKPLITRHLETNDHLLLQKEIIQVNRIRYIIVWGITLHLFLNPESYLLGFGSDYLHIIHELMVCAVCYHIYTICQPALDYMIFGGHQKVVSHILQIKLITICILAYFLIPKYGLMGAVISDSVPAAASAISAAIWVKLNRSIRILAIR